ncbi:hypothetical protein N9L26_01140 [Candidatus Pacebacteria bacterium]|nr:hypothetical protein [Candidatus Paceibacterota bacterium]
MNLAQNTFFTKALDIIVPFGPLLRRLESAAPFTGWKDLIFHVLPFTFFVYWLFSFIPFVGGALYLLLLVPLSAKRHIALTDNTNHARVYLWYLTVVVIGFAGIWSFIGHFFMSDYVARQIGWATGSPFQIELAFYTLGSAVAALLAVWLRGHIITALVVSKAIFWYGAAYVHLQDAILHSNYSPLNIGTPLINDILFPTVLLTLLFYSLKNESDTNHAGK